MENNEILETIDSTPKATRFRVFDWILLIGAIVMLPCAIMLLIGDASLLFLYSSSANLSQLFIDAMVLGASGWVLRIKLKKYRGIKTPKSYKIILIITWSVATLILIPTIFATYTVIHKAKTATQITPQQQQVLDTFLAKVGEFQVANKNVKLYISALSKIENNQEYNKKSKELLNYAKILQIKLDDLRNYFDENFGIFDDTPSEEAFQAVKEVFEFRTEHNKKLIELADLGSRINFQNETQTNQFLILVKEMGVIEARLPEVETKFLRAIAELQGLPPLPRLPKLSPVP